MAFRIDKHTCRFCGQSFAHAQEWQRVATDVRGVWFLFAMYCPGCRHANFCLGLFPISVNTTSGTHTLQTDGHGIWGANTTYTVEPIEPLIFIPPTALPPKAPGEVPELLAEDYNEAYLILDLSPKASAALSRRCLQGVLTDQGYTQRDLINQIKAAVEDLPPHLGQMLDTIRHVGNFAAHPMKDTATGEILPVEPHEAETILTVIERLFDHYYVQTAKNREFITTLNVKLQAIGKSPIPVP